MGGQWNSMLVLLLTRGIFNYGYGGIKYNLYSVGFVEKVFHNTHLKKNNYKDFDDYNPKTLCNSIYNIIEKIIPSNLEKVYLEAISQEKLKFLHNKQMHDAMGVAQEHVHSI